MCLNAFQSKLNACIMLFVNVNECVSINILKLLNTFTYKLLKMQDKFGCTISNLHLDLGYQSNSS